ncbi:MAG: Flp pilus assembly protein CpaB [Pseudomonadota bacterium]
MRRSPLIMLALSVVFGFGAVHATRVYLNQNEFISPALANTPATSTIVVAATPVRFGEPLTTQNLREIEWVEGALPNGAFATRQALLEDGERFALGALEKNEPILAVKISGPDQRAALSAMMAPGKRAVTIRINDVLGVAGFVLPGDRVDVLLTRTFRSSERDEASFVDVLIQGVKVLAVDQRADSRTDEAVVAKAATLEVSPQQAQKLTLAAEIGQLSLALRHVTQHQAETTQRITVADLGLTPEVALPNVAPPAPAKTQAPAPQPQKTVTVYHGMERKLYDVGR